MIIITIIIIIVTFKVFRPYLFHDSNKIVCRIQVKGKLGNVCWMGHMKRMQTKNVTSHLHQDEEVNIMYRKIKRN